MPSKYDVYFIEAVKRRITIQEASKIKLNEINHNENHTVTIVIVCSVFIILLQNVIIVVICVRKCSKNKLKKQTVERNESQNISPEDVFQNSELNISTEEPIFVQDTASISSDFIFDGSQ